MLIAELHGKRCAAADGNEDYLTSAVFRHLRSVRDGRFWSAVFKRARSVGPTMTTLLADDSRYDTCLRTNAIASTRL
jgi:hypothetical protein